MVFVKRETVKRTVRLEPVERQSRAFSNEGKLAKADCPSAIATPATGL